jgi:predicted SAM-dependent methyltransferase
MKINLGGGPKKIEGYINVDVQDWNGTTDIVHDLTIFPWPFKEHSVDEILCQEVLEHIEIKYAFSFLYECYRILRSGGKFELQVPDCGKAMEYYVNGEICTCVSHKEKEWSNYHADEKCFKSCTIEQQPLYSNKTITNKSIL